jgi:predicted CoA-binding protein
MPKETLVLGATADPTRYAYIAINRLLLKGHPVVGIGLKEESVGEVDIKTTKEPFDDIDTVTLYLNPRRQKEYYDYIVSLRPKRVVFNPGTENPELYEILRKNGIEVEVACTLVMLAINQY